MKALYLLLMCAVCGFLFYVIITVVDDSPVVASILFTAILYFFSDILSHTRPK
jgi:hypothetical protein